MTPRSGPDGRPDGAGSSDGRVEGPGLPPAAVPDDPAFEAHVLRAFVKGDRLVAIPARERKKRVILRFLLDRVLPDDAPVEERDLNLRLALWNPDVALLRRAFVDSGLAARSGMVYRRAIPTPAEVD